MDIIEKNQKYYNENRDYLKQKSICRYWDKREECLSKSLERYNNKKEEINAKRKVKVACPHCGKLISKNNLAKHIKLKHSY
jgi:predicted RNA-binding Zn-ribbon protein involved in translation (DUF1610 family)